MGYYTDHSLSILSDMNFDVGVDNPQTKEAMVEWVRKNDPDMLEGFEEMLLGGYAFNCKWYEHQDDMKVFSLAFPGVLFEMCGAGEEEEDKWKEYYLDGKMQRCQAVVTVVYPAHDPDLMK